MYDPAVAQILGFASDVLEERWTGEDGPGAEEIRVIERCLCLLGFPTGEGGRPAIDGEFGPGVRRAVRWFQEEAELPPTGRLDEASRTRLYGTAAAFLESMAADQRSRARGQLDRAQNLPRPTHAWVIRYYLGEAEKRIPAELQAAFLAIVGWANCGIALAGLDLPAYEANRRALPPREARLAAHRYGYLQLPHSWFAARPHLPPARALVAGDADFHFDVAAEVLMCDPAVHEAAVMGDAEALARALPWLAADCVIHAPFGLAEFLTQVREALARS